jgi:hypothetical protein
MLVFDCRGTIRNPVMIYGFDIAKNGKWSGLTVTVRIIEAREQRKQKPSVLKPISSSVMGRRIQYLH